VDPWFFVEAAPELTPLIYHARKVNDGQPQFVVDKVRHALGSLPGKRIAALGLAYKPDVDDLRESPAVEVVHLLQNEGALVKAWEPFKPEAQLPNVVMANSLEDAIKDADAILLLVSHTQFKSLNPDELASQTHARVAVDCVHAWSQQSWTAAGFTLHHLGVNKSPSASLKA
jgi:UDP-N-acetyl-D-mannosaminuronic acid dehydrogenase